MTSHLYSCTAYPQNPVNIDTQTNTHTHTRHYAKIYWVTLYKSIMGADHPLTQKKERFVQSLQ